MIKITKKVVRLFHELDNVNDLNLFLYPCDEESIAVMYKNNEGRSSLKSKHCETTKELKKELKRLIKEAE